MGVLTLLFGAVRNAASGAFTWLTANIAHLLAAMLAIALLFGLYERHEAGKWHRADQSDAAARKSDNATWGKAFATERGSVVLLTGALDEQNKAVAGLKAESDRRVAANHEALQKLAESQRTAEALSARMKAAFASSGAQAGKDGQCKSDATVLDAAKGGAL
jgi:hypothetical protein